MNMMVFNSYKYDVLKHMDYRGCLELLAEEASELSQAALKMVRALEPHGTYPVNKDKYDTTICMNNMVEEATDVFICFQLLDLYAEDLLAEKKIKQMLERFEDIPKEE